MTLANWTKAKRQNLGKWKSGQNLIWQNSNQQNPNQQNLNHGQVYNDKIVIKLHERMITGHRKLLYTKFWTSSENEFKILYVTANYIPLLFRECTFGFIPLLNNIWRSLKVGYRSGTKTVFYLKWLKYQMSP